MCVCFTNFGPELNWSVWLYPVVLLFIFLCFTSLFSHCGRTLSTLPLPWKTGSEAEEKMRRRRKKREGGHGEFPICSSFLLFCACKQSHVSEKSPLSYTSISNRPPLCSYSVYTHIPMHVQLPLLARVGAPSASCFWSRSLKLCSLPWSTFCLMPCNVYFRRFQSLVSVSLDHLGTFLWPC